jgi:t-SNARE complex subunit (syntaxin)
MAGRFVFGFCMLAPCVLGAGVAHAQDVPGIEICTVEKTMERRTSCLQSNVEFLQKTIAKLDLQHQQKLDAANRQIESLKASLAALQKAANDLQAAQKKPADDLPKDASKGPSTKDPSTKDAPAKDGAAKDGAAKNGTAKENGK